MGNPSSALCSEGAGHSHEKPSFRKEILSHLFMGWVSLNFIRKTSHHNFSPTPNVCRRRIPALAELLPGLRVPVLRGCRVGGFAAVVILAREQRIRQDVYVR